jgi:hypothetical protein
LVKRQLLSLTSCSDVAGVPNVDLLRPDLIVKALLTFSPNIVINPAADAVDRAKYEPALAFAINRDGARIVASAAPRWAWARFLTRTFASFLSDDLIGAMGGSPDAIEAAVVLAAVKDAARRWRGGPKTGHPWPPLRAAAGISRRSGWKNGSAGVEQKNANWRKLHANFFWSR